MPELPEVETTRQQILPYLKHSLIQSLQYEPSARYLNLERLEGQTIEDVSRRGKYLIIPFGKGKWELIIHLGMTGGFQFTPDSHTRLTLRTSVGKLYFRDTRRFGFWRTVATGDYHFLPTLQAMGPEPLTEDFKLEPFIEMAHQTKMVKPWLLSQKPVAGLGNIYTDEALFEASIHPESGKLSPESAARLHHAVRAILSRATLAGGSTLSDQSYMQPNGELGRFQFQHQVYGREGQPCPKCETPIKKYHLRGRGTHFCPQCQGPQKNY